MIALLYFINRMKDSFPNVVPWDTWNTDINYESDTEK